MFQRMKEQILPGATTLDLDRWATEYIKKLGGKPAFRGYQGFPGALCTSINEEVIHGIPSNRKIESGDLLSVDCGIDLNGYFSDMAYTFLVGESYLSSREELLMKVTEESLYKGIEAAQLGKRIKDISRAVSDHVKPHNFGIVTDYGGHGVGLAQHEDPHIPNYVSVGPNPRLQVGMVLAIEPMINLGTGKVRVLSDDWTVITQDRKKSAHFEHTVAILEDRTEILTLL